MSSLGNQLQKLKESEQLIRNLNRKCIKKKQRVEIGQPKCNVKIIDEDFLHLYGLVKKTNLSKNQQILEGNLIIWIK